MASTEPNDDAADHDPSQSQSCLVAHGAASSAATGDVPQRRLVAVFDSPVARLLAHYATDAGYQVQVVDPVVDRNQQGDLGVASGIAELDAETDVVVTDHHRHELGDVLAQALAAPTRWIGVMGNPHHEGPHVAALRERGVGDADIARVHRPIGLNIGSRTPAEIALSTLAGLIADRNDRPGGFEF